ncbi:protein of unknown function [Candidatus Hydrogenisulfobacillus filiaventi]|uniref:SHOCT domain-containing protein n=1 Tax=Candidatus Hydrogenisulfobacillus filiaventi TaxID=2707344 RepID=A0A6F8ZFI4_9FIRM|nr:SHOCT domain-containing protein [Bacillota bacterium]CAB1128222.1 protein of unknown function [Candidatus Hydrogenisulfobacillus filiaventi]
MAVFMMGHTGNPLLVLAVMMTSSMLVFLGMITMAYRVLTGPRDHPAPRTPPPDPLEVARERYARGEIDHREFERIAANLLRSERPKP